MLCDQCKTRQANLFLENIVNGKKQKLSLCSQCAQEMGLGGGHPLFSQLFGQGLLGLGSQATNLWAKNTSCEVCQSCGTGYQDFQKNGLFGCPDCYEAFGPKLSSVFKRVQAGESHVGRRLAGSVGIKNLTYTVDVPVQELKETSAHEEERIEKETNGKEGEVKKLKAEQDLAVAQEDYEKAAHIRDRIKALQAEIEAKAESKETKKPTKEG